MNHLKKIIKTEHAASVSVMRMILGWIMFLEGAQKLFGWFGGRGLEATRAFYDALNVPLSPYHAVIIGSIEFFGGTCLLLGFLTRLAAFPIAVNMVGAMWIVTALSGHFHNNHLIGFAICLVLLEFGGGAFSVDHLLIREKK